MTLEELFQNPIFRFTWFPVRWGVAAASFLVPSATRHLAKKMRELFSPRLNDLLYENLFLYNKRVKGFTARLQFINTNTPILLDLDLEMKDYVQAHFYFHGMPAFFLQLLSFCDSRTAFFDIGANMGIISAAISRFIPEGNIFAFEALPGTYGRLDRVFQRNCPSAHSYNIALSSNPGELTFQIPDSDSGSASASESSDELIAIRDKNVRLRSEIVQATTFDDFFYDIETNKLIGTITRHAFKIDVEGHELEVLRGMKRYFSEFRGDILLVVEVRQKNACLIHSLLTDCGFTSLNHETTAANMLELMRDCIYFRQYQ